MGADVILFTLKIIRNLDFLFLNERFSKYSLWANKVSITGTLV